jgi:hypothetical protein
MAKRKAIDGTGFLLRSPRNAAELRKELGLGRKRSV